MAFQRQEFATSPRGILCLYLDCTVPGRSSPETRDADSTRFYEDLPEELREELRRITFALRHLPYRPTSVDMLAPLTILLQFHRRCVQFIRNRCVADIDSRGASSSEM